MNKESHEIKPTPLNHYFNYKVNYGEAIIFFFLTIIGGQFIGGIFSLLMLAFPVLTDVLLPMSFLFGFGFAAAIIMVLKKLKPTELNHFFHSRINILHFALAIALYIAVLPLAEYFTMLIPTEGIPILEEYYKIVESSFAMVFDHKIAAFIMICILAPILEEFIFRGLILRGMLNNGMNPWISILFTAFLFGAAHLNPWQFVGAGLLGAIFGFVYWRTQSLWLVIFLHFLNNFIAFIVTMKTQNLDESVFEPNLWLLLVAFFLSLFVGYTFYRLSGATALKEIKDLGNFKEFP